MAILEKLQTDLVTALKAKDQVTADTLRGLKTRIQNESIAKGKSLEDADIHALIRSEVKKRKEAAEEFESAGRTELAEKENAELAVLKTYLPQGPSSEVYAQAIETVFSEGVFTQKDFGALMAKAKSILGEGADMSHVSTLIKDRLNQ